MVSGNLSIMYGITGPNMSLVSACATGTHSIGDAARLIKHGYVDCMIAGGAEMATCPLGIGGFASAKALCSTNNDDPETASKPWDINRNGFVLGDGAGIVILEEVTRIGCAIRYRSSGWRQIRVHRQCQARPKTPVS